MEPGGVGGAIIKLQCLPGQQLMGHWLQNLRPPSLHHWTQCLFFESSFEHLLPSGIFFPQLLNAKYNSNSSSRNNCHNRSTLVRLLLGILLASWKRKCISFRCTWVYSMRPVGMAFFPLNFFLKIVTPDFSISVWHMAVAKLVWNEGIWSSDQMELGWF